MSFSGIDCSVFLKIKSRRDELLIAIKKNIDIELRRSDLIITFDLQVAPTELDVKSTCFIY